MQIKIQSMVTKLRSKRKGCKRDKEREAFKRMTAFYVETSLLKRVLGYCNTSLQLQRKEMSYNNYLGVDSAWNCVSDSENPTCAVMKHTNPCGEAYQIAVIADPGSTFGGIVAANVKVDKNIVLSELQYNPVVIERNMFRFRSFQEFERYHPPMKVIN
ncbi:PREDICTED: bifunctional purine biosynthesis protein PurH-like isoform X2 [Brassica oleracea var. oleracea]|uniref:bifunctional purine biosynthesis protein PurH-like isoform X2 n=1 Tax=Brassica oleracea var. oleracea TaxID=109376 RepID=UPI0006A71632|nr:PREDICTED: bifunctional purine biosynthesis protein PurH-like isoform X2 [Brassica oleracea var. oleracea]